MTLKFLAIFFVCSNVNPPKVGFFEFLVPRGIEWYKELCPRRCPEGFSLSCIASFSATYRIHSTVGYTSIFTVLRVSLFEGYAPAGYTYLRQTSEVKHYSTWAYVLQYKSNLAESQLVLVLRRRYQDGNMVILWARQMQCRM